jgi:hypothetical protein
MGFLINELNRGLVVNGRRIWISQIVNPPSTEFGISILQSYDVSLYDTSTSVSIPLSGFTDESRMVAFLSYQLFNGANTTVYNAYSQLDACVNSISEVILQRGRTGTGFHVNATVSVAQFSPSTTVYKGIWSMNTTSMAQDVSISNSNIVCTSSNTFMFHHIQTDSIITNGADGAPVDRDISLEFLNPSSIHFQRYNASRGNAQGHWYVVTHPDISVFHGTMINQTGDTTSPIGFVVDTSTTFILASHRSSAVTYNQEGGWRFYINPATNSDVVTQAWYGGETTPTAVHYQLIQHPNLYVQQKLIRAVDSSNATSITPVDINRSIAISTLRSGYSRQPRYEDTWFNHCFFRFSLNSSTYSNAYVEFMGGGNFQDTAYQVIQFPLI